MNFDVGNTPESLNFLKREEPFVSTHSFGSGQYNLGSLDQNLPGMSSLGGLSDDAIVLESAKARLQQNLVTLRNAPDFLRTMQTAFGDQWDPAQAKAVVDDVIRGEADITFEISDAEDLLSKGAYGENTVFISDDLLTGGSGTSAVLDDVLLEEVGHYFDQDLNSEDSPGDEGAIFSRLAQGQTFSDLELLRFGKENDHFLLPVNDRLIAVEQSDDFSAHTVQAGETLWGIATSQLGDGTRWTEILKDSEDPSSTFSETEAGQIQPGETIYLPGSESSSTPLDTDQSQGSSEDASETNSEEPATADPIVADTAAPVPESPSTETITDAGSYPGYVFEYEEGQAFVEDANVEEWQQRMSDLGWTIGVDGKYGAESARVAEEFQTLYDDLTNDGIVGEQTWAKTFSADALGPSPEEESDPTVGVLEEPSTNEEPSGNYIELVSLPDKASINLGINTPSQSFMQSALGDPNIGSTSYEYSHLIETRNVGPFTVTGLRPMLHGLEDIFAQVKVDNPQLFEDVQEIGMFVRRAKKNSSGNEISGTISNHSWGSAIDLYFGESFDFTEDGRTNRGLVELAPYFHERGYIWGAGFSNFEDPGHFEASSQLIQQWQANNWNPVSFDSQFTPENPDSPSSGGTEFSEEVQKYQEKLLELDYELPNFGADGAFGNETADAIGDFQLEHGLEVTEEFDDATIEALGWEHLIEKIGQENILGNVSSGISVKGSVGNPIEYDPSVSSTPGKDESDLYEFSVSNNQPIKIHLGILSGSQAGLTLLDGSRNIITSADGILSNDISVRDLSAGEYFVRVTSTSGETEYLLSISDEINSNSNSHAEVVNLDLEKAKDPTLLDDQELVDLSQGLNKQIDDWSGTDNDPILEQLVQARNSVLEELEDRLSDSSLPDQQQINEALVEISKLLHTDPQSNLTPQIDGDREVTTEEVLKIFGVLDGLNDDESTQVLQQLSQEEKDKFETVLNDGEFVEPGGLGNTIWTPARLVGNAVKDTIGGFGDLGDAVLVYYEQIGNVTAQSLLNRGGGSTLPVREYFQPPLTLEESNSKAADILAAGDAPIFSNAVRCNRGDGSSCGWLAAEIALEVAGGFVIGRVTSVVGRVGRNLIVRLGIRNGDEIGEEIVTSIPREVAEEILQKSDGSPIDFESFGSEFIDDSLRTVDDAADAGTTTNANVPRNESPVTTIDSTPNISGRPPEPISSDLISRKGDQWIIDLSKIDRDPNIIIGDTDLPASAKPADVAREAFAVQRTAHRTNIEKVYVGEEADSLINPDVKPGTDLGVDVVGVTYNSRYVLTEAKGTSIDHALEQLEYSGQQLGVERIDRYEIVIPEQINTIGFSIENEILYLNGQPYLINNKEVFVRTTTFQ